MKQNLFLLLAAVLMISACGGPKGEFTINGTIEGHDGEEIYLYRILDQESYATTTDTCVISNGKFTFKGNIETPFDYSVILIGDIDDYRNPDSYTCYIEPGEMTVEIDGADFKNSVLKGSPVQQEYDKFMALMQPHIEKITAIRDKYDNESDNAVREELMKEMEELRVQYEATRDEYISNNPDSYISPMELRVAMSDMKFEELKAVYDKFTDKVKASPAAKEIRKELEAMESVLPGKPAPDMEKVDINGNPFSLARLKGKVILLDFWASWCVPCRASNPHLLEVYKKYHDKGLEIVCVADNDDSEDKWKKAIEEDGIGAFHHVLRGLKVSKDENGRHIFDSSEDFSDLYAVHYIPTKYLIDREGKIICKVENDKQLDEELEKLFE